MLWSKLKSVALEVEPRRPDPAPTPRVTTLLDLVRVVKEEARSDREVVAVIVHLLETKQVALGGIFAGRRIEVSL